MGIIAWPYHKPLAATVLCVICGRTTDLQDATAGMIDAHNNQTFACNGHFWDEHKFIVGWAEFSAEQRYGL